MLGFEFSPCQLVCQFIRSYSITAGSISLQIASGIPGFIGLFSSSYLVSTPGKTFRVSSIYDLLRKEFLELQLVLAGGGAGDDPEGRSRHLDSGITSNYNRYDAGVAEWQTQRT